MVFTVFLFVPNLFKLFAILPEKRKSSLIYADDAAISPQCLSRLQNNLN